MNHIILLGDSIFDNAAYVDEGPDVIRQLTVISPSDFKATLLAVDGSVTTNVIDQIPEIPTSATHLFVSAGGNDGLSRADVLQRPAGSVGAAVDQLAALRSEFHQNYRRMLSALLALKLPPALCTVFRFSCVEHRPHHIMPPIDKTNGGIIPVNGQQLPTCKFRPFNHQPTSRK